MAMGDEVPGGPQGADAGGGGAAPSPPTPGGGPGGNPVLASLARQQQGPQPSAPGPGDQAASMSQVQTALGMLNSALPGLLGTPIHQHVLRTVQLLSKHMAQGQPTAGVQQTQIQDLLRNVVKNSMLSKIMGQQQQGGGEGGAMSPAPMPSTPLPGA